MGYAGKIGAKGRQALTAGGSLCLSRKEARPTHPGKDGSLAPWYHLNSQRGCRCLEIDNGMSRQPLLWGRLRLPAWFGAAVWKPLHRNALPKPSQLMGFLSVGGSSAYSSSALHLPWFLSYANFLCLSSVSFSLQQWLAQTWLLNLPAFVLFVLIEKIHLAFIPLLRLRCFPYLAIV